MRIVAVAKPKMEIDLRSSSNEPLSDVPSDYEKYRLPESPSYHSAQSNINVAANSGVANHFDARQPGVAASATAAGTRQEPQPTKRARKPRLPKDPNAPLVEKKVPKPRKPRVASTNANTAAARKKTKVEPVEDESTIHIPGPQNPTLQSSTLVQPVTFTPQPPAESRRNEAAKPSESSFTMHDRPMHSYTSPPLTYDYKPNVAAPPPQSSTPRTTPMYDPIRGTQRSLDTNPPAPIAQPAMTPPRPTYNPSTSPAISGIMNYPPQSEYPHSSMLVTHPPRAEPSYSHTNGRAVDAPTPAGDLSAMDLDIVEKDQAQVKKPAGVRKVPSEAPTRQTSPKPARAKEQPPPPPMGSGLLSASLFGGDSNNGAAQKDSEKGPNIVLHVDLRDPANRVINFARMAEAKYGFAALYPRQAAQKERLAKIAAAGAALERSASASKLGGTSAESGDEDLSVDIDRDSENDGDVAMSGLNGGQDAGNSGTDGPGIKRRRRRKVEEYDVDDDFVDDTELLWEAQAAASKDGFFVYCGPLVPEGEKPAVERYVNFLSTVILTNLP